jgi:hypothetical protein
MYLLYLVAGVIACVYPSQVILNAVQTTIAYLWSGFLVVGGGASLYGIVSDVWTGEIVGIPLAGSAQGIFGVALIAYGTTSASAAIGLMFIAVGFGMIGRWIEVRQIAKISQGRS